MLTATRPIFAELSHNFAYTMLKRLHVGRLAYSLHDRVDIQPINYVFDDGWIFGRTAVGSKLSKLTHNPWCAFEVDDVRGLFEWDSVVVKGSFHILDPEQGSPDRYRRALEVLRELIPGTLGPNDPAPERMILFGIHVDEMTGRSARP